VHDAGLVGALITVTLGVWLDGIDITVPGNVSKGGLYSAIGGRQAMNDSEAASNGPESGDLPPPDPVTVVTAPPLQSSRWADRSGPATVPRVSWREVEPRPTDHRLLIAVAVGAVAADLAWRRPPFNNLAGTIAVLAVAAAVIGSGRVRDRSAQGAVGLAAVLGVFLWIRTAPALVTFDVIGVLGLTWYGVAHSRGRSLWDTSPIRIVLRGGTALALAIETVPDSVLELATRRHRARERTEENGHTQSGVAGGLLRGLLIALPLLVLLGVLLASADAVFASFFDFEVDASFDVGRWFGHAVLLGLGGVAMLVLLRLGGRDLDAGDEPKVPVRLGLVEALVVLVGLNLLFAAFGVAQIVALSGGAERVLESAGLTVKQYARQGFFQLLWVAGITAVALIALDVSTRHLERGRRAVQAASLVSVALTLVIVVVAFGRLRLYISDDGLTPLRLYSSVFSVWIGVVFLLLAARIWGLGARTHWLTSAVIASAAAFLIALNVANPGAVIATNNLHRDAPTILYHMEKLSADGNVVLIEGIDRLSPDLRTEVARKLCGDLTVASVRDEATGLSYNRSEARLDGLFLDLCGAP